MMETRPITDLRDTTAISELCHSLDEPAFISKEGHVDMVIMSMEVYNRITAPRDLHQKLDAGLQQIREGKVQDGPAALAALREKHGI